LGEGVKSSRTLTSLVKEKARELGFSRIGIARAQRLDEEGARLQKWLTKGYHASMAWMGRDPEKRSDVRAIVPNAKSVISVATNYFAPASHSTDPQKAKISRYAWGDDYHVVLTPRIQELVRCIKLERPDLNAACYVDTGPVMDKAWAVRAGIGWLGKHTNVISKEYGSWIFLGEVIVDLELEYDEPMADFCGSCRACIDACPTGAIVEPYVLDSNKCISYLTIEHRGELPDELKPHLENWVFGCDICQDVCPWNRFQQPTDDRSFFPRGGNVAPDLNALETITSEEFSARFKGSPVKRTKREGLVRNAKAVREGRGG
jgi:epoxyqueuosine reductase